MLQAAEGDAGVNAVDLMKRQAESARREVQNLVGESSVPLLRSASYAECPYYFVRYIQIVLVI